MSYIEPPKPIQQTANGISYSAAGLTIEGRAHYAAMLRVPVTISERMGG